MDDKRDKLVNDTVDAYYESTGNLPDDDTFTEIEHVVDDYLKDEQ